MNFTGAKMPVEKDSTDWNAVTARSLAYQSMHLAGLAEATVVKKAEFLMALGLSRQDAALLLGSSAESLRVMIAQAAKKKPAAR